MSSSIDNPRVRSLLLKTFLKEVSRSFYLTLAAVPRSVRDQIGLAYLFARAADTIADTELIDRPQRLQYLIAFRSQFAAPERVDWAALRALQAALVPHQQDSSERRLLERLEDGFRIYGEFSLEDRVRICRLMTTLTKGMEMDLTRFPGTSASELTALRMREDLDLYTYYVAGCVGEFWTAMVCAHLPALASWDQAAMAARGVRFGKGLQLTNILKDLPHDLQRGRCYVPQALLEEVNLRPEDLLDADTLPRFRPVLRRLLRETVEHLDQGWIYTMMIPRSQFRLRLACMWPILFAGATLGRISHSTDALNPAKVLKITRGEVYRIMGATLLTGACGYVGSAYWGMLRKRIV